ncbi:MAG: CopG family transcriptional regulator [Elusimicrobia bacterium CG_4_9_14_3_um_filter_62_55]|nr:MAG: CopG family transcriptional regulator [Elusimicrobia bacterium CG22_combo_CG10-13_8_21_14_all_63_91]PJA14635.1 MAG: CopG family transcriptional regulator [Elusimicrobia bacterium CG_4_10_14_0_2_um_filter_63_34]PJB26192.1 MAG: CopG family transcriptional regulator [Elusimicrobia bacterium CG_4_9_14_3_um_filter_62_55]
MPKTITLRLADRVYETFRSYAEADNRPISNLIETAALKHLEECSLISPSEMRSILADEYLVAGLKSGSRAARGKKGRFVA